MKKNDSSSSLQNLSSPTPLSADSPAPKEGQEASPFRPGMVVLDDDPIVAMVMKEHLKLRYPQAEIEVRSDAVVPPGFDVYFLDNDFGGQLMALHLLRQVRELVPHALVIALSNTLDLEVLERLVNEGCNAVYNKRSPEHSEAAQEVIDNYLAVVELRQRQKQSRGISRLVDSMSRLVGEWNRRLERDVGGHDPEPSREVA